jgi:lysophospholipase L1-like esterase
LETGVNEHIALLGDSILDNAAYTRGLPDVIGHLRQLLPDGVSATLLAVDGSTTADLGKQMARLPSDVSRVVVSIGGNDALLNVDALDLPITSTGEAIRMFEERAALFEASYREALAGIVRRVPSPVVCTIYNPLLGRDEAVAARVGLMLFNDAILRVAFEWRLPVVDLRLVIVEPSDYANPLEPSSQGAAKIAKAIAAALGLPGEDSAASKVFVG